MAELLLLEGDDLPGLMVRVRDELGPRATIVRAERVRRGGIAGFFAREHYELTVEVPDPPAPRPAPRPAAPVVLPPGTEGLEALLDAADRAERGDDEGALASSTPLSLSSSAGASGAAGAGASAEETPPTPPVSTAGARFAAVLQGVRALAGEPEPADVTVPEATGRGVLADGASAVAGGGAAAAGASGMAGAVAGAALGGAAGAALGGAGNAASGAGRSSVVVRAPEPPAAVVARQSWGQAAVALLAAGVPSELLDRAGSVEQVLDRIPEPSAPPRRAGQVLVLVGRHEAVTSTAALLRHQWQLPADAVVEAGPEGLTSTTAIVRWRMHTTQAGHPWLLVVGVGDDPTARQLATGMVAAAQPDQVWAVVDARTKRDDAARWLEQVGAARRPDALAVQGLLDTSDPGTVLGLGLPVAWADGVPASRVLWAAVLGQGVDVALGRRR